MSTILRLLILEDNPDDAELLVITLKKAGYTCQWERVKTRDDFLACLDTPNYDLILSDYSLPAFDGLTVLKLYQEQGLDLPFIFVSGKLGEENAIESLKAGATDYVLKHRLSRLPQVIQRALREQQKQQERKRTEKALRKANRAYRVLSDCNRALIRASAETEFLQEVCQIIVAMGGYRLAWVGFAEQDEAKMVRPVAQMGYEAGYLDTLNITWANTEQGCGPTGTTIRTGQPEIARDILANPNFSPWQEAALQRGYASSIALPLLTEGQTLGALNIYATEPDAFDDDEVALLLELAGELTYGLVALRTQANHRQAERVVAESEQRFRSVAQSAAEAIIIANAQGQIIFWNKGAQTIFGYAENEVLNQSLTILIPKRFREAHLRGLTRFKSSDQSNITGRVIELHGLRKDGNEFPLELSLTSWQTEKETFFSGIIRDITDRKQTEHTLFESRILLNEAGKMAKVGGWIIDLATNELTWTEEVYHIHEVDMSFQPTVETALNFYAPSSRPIIQKAIETAIQEGRGFDLELDLITAKGNKIKVHALGSVQPKEDKPMIVIGAFQDITHRKQTEELLKQRAAQLALINDIGSKVAAMLELDTVLDRAAHLVQGVFKYHHVAMFLLENDVLKLRALSGSYELYFPVDHTQQPSEGINGWVATHGKIVVANDVTLEPRYTSLIAEYSVTQAELCLPIKIANQTVGILDIQSPHKHLFTENDVMAMETLTNQLAVAIENARLYESIRRKLSERRQTQTELRASEERFHQVISSISDHIYMTELTAEGQHLNHYISLNVEDLTGYPKEKFLTNWGFWSSIIHTDDSAIAARQLNRLTMGQNTETEYRLIQANGQVIWVRDSSRVEISNGSKFIYGVVSNITERKEAVAQMRLQAVALGAAANTIIITDRAGVINWVNPAFTHLTGYTAAEVIGNTPKLLNSGNHQQTFFRQLWDTILAGQVWYGEITNRRKDNSLYTEDMTITPVQNESREITHFIAIKHDITERKQAEEEIRKLNQNLEQRVIDRTRELSALYEVTSVASESLDLETTLEQSLDRVLEAMRTNMGVIHLLDEVYGTSGEKSLRVAAQQGLSINIMTQSETTSANSDLASWIIEHSEPLIVPDVITDPRALQLTNIDPDTTYVGVPMRARGRVLGTLGVLKKNELSQFSVDEITLLTSIADHVGVVVESTRLRQRVEQAAILEERGRLARELHDSVTQSLYGLTLFAKTGWALTKTRDLAGVKHNLERISETAQQALKEMRLLVYELHPLDLKQEGLAAALRRRLNAVEGRAHIKARMQAEELGKLPILVEQGLYRIAQEALNNALKHAAATSVTIYLHLKEGKVELDVVDDGIGFNPQAVQNKGGIGLISMQERAVKLGGSLTILSVPGQGTRIKASVKPNL